MPISTIVKRGIGFNPGSLKWVPTAGYSLSAVSLVVNPSAASVLLDAVINFTASLPSTWESTCGDLVVAGDNLSAVYTAPGTPGKCVVTVTEIGDEGNSVDITVVVLSSFARGIVDATGAGSAVDATRVGAYQGGAATPASPVLLPDLVARWALTGGPQQTMNSGGVIASGPLDYTEHGDIDYDTGWARFNDVAANLTTGFSSLLRTPDSSPVLMSVVFDLANGGDLATAGRWSYETDNFGAPLQLEAQYSGNVPANSVADADRVADDFNSYYTPTVVPNAGTNVVFAWWNPSTRTVSVRLNNDAPVSSDPIVETLSDENSTFVNTLKCFGAVPGRAKYPTLWIGANALVIANNATYMAFLATMPTDAQLAAYTG